MDDFENGYDTGYDNGFQYGKYEAIDIAISMFREKPNDELQTKRSIIRNLRKLRDAF